MTEFTGAGLNLAAFIYVAWREPAGSRPRIAVKTKRCSLRGEEENSHQRRTTPWRKESLPAPGLNRPSPPCSTRGDEGSWDADRLSELGRLGARLIMQRAEEDIVRLLREPLPYHIGLGVRLLAPRPPTPWT